MKKLAFIGLVITFLYSFSLMSQPIEHYSCLANDGGICTSEQAIVLTVEWITPETVQITRSSRLATDEDNFSCYNLTTQPTVIENNQAFIPGGPNVWIVQFNNFQMVAAGGGGGTFSCKCSGTGGCDVEETTKEIKCKKNGCDACCNGKIVWDAIGGGTGNEFALAIQAVNVILVDNIGLSY